MYKYEKTTSCCCSNVIQYYFCYQVTKNKQWKDVASVMGIGASSSGSYTLRKHYMKHVLSYECRFDRGGIDPQPIISQIEASAKKKTTKTVSVPSPGEFILNTLLKNS